MTALNATAAIAASYFLGSIPFGLIAGRLMKGIDLRDVGSGNLGATNAFRVLGPVPGIAVLVADGAKGALAVLLAKSLAGGAGALAGGSGAAGGGADMLALLIPVLCAPAAMAGHTWTIFAGFRGGKGVAAGAGAFLALAPVAAGVAIGVWALLFILSGYVSVGSMGAAVAFPVAVVLLGGGPGRTYLVAVSVAAAVLILVRHVSNMKRLAAGTESRVLWRAGRGR